MLYFKGILMHRMLILIAILPSIINAGNVHSSKKHPLAPLTISVTLSRGNNPAEIVSYVGRNYISNKSGDKYKRSNAPEIVSNKPSSAISLKLIAVALNTNKQEASITYQVRAGQEAIPVTQTETIEFEHTTKKFFNDELLVTMAALYKTSTDK